jgi:hypothetical protein
MAHATLTPGSCHHSHNTHTSSTTPFCTYCHHTLGRLQKALQHKPFLKKKIAYVQSIMNNHSTRDIDNVLTCPMLKSYKCFKCGEYGHTPSRCTPCEYCEHNGHNDRECPKKRADEKHKSTTIVLKITKKVGFEDILDKLKTFCHEHAVDIVKEI